MADWSLLPKDILELIAGRFKTCFEIVHLRSVCSSWWCALPPKISLGSLGKRSLLPIFNDNPRFEGDEHCILKKIPVFLLRFETPFGNDYLLAAMSEKKSGKQRLLSPLENTYKYKYGVTLNTLSSQIIPLGQYYKVVLLYFYLSFYNSVSLSICLNSLFDIGTILCYNDETL